MKSDDPKLTAFVLNELTPEEQEQVLRAIEADGFLAAEVDELQRFAAGLRAGLQNETADSLTPEQRAAVLGENPAREESIVIPSITWWKNPWIPSAAAAAVVAGLATTIYFQAKYIERLTTQQAVTTVTVPGVAFTFPSMAQAGAGDLDTSAAPELSAPELLIPPPRPTPMLPAWNTQLEIALLGNSTADSEPVPVPDIAPQIEPQGDPVMDPEAGKQSDVSGGPRKMVAAAASSGNRRSVGGSVSKNGLKSAGAAVERELSDTESTSATATSTPSNPTGRDYGKRLTPTEKKVQKELRDLKERLESLERRQRSEANKESQDPALKQTIEHVRRTLAALQATQTGQSNTEAYDEITDNPFLTVKENQLSTFSADVDTASYSNVRRFLESNQRPPKGAVRIEELLNYFRYDYPQPKGKELFSCTTEVASCPWAPNHRLVRIGLKGREIAKDQRPPANLVFLVDVSGSMKPDNRLPLVKDCLRVLTDQLGTEDTVAIVVYAGASGCVLESTRDMNKVRAALDRLEAGGSKNGAAGIQLAYDLAQRSFKRGASNRIILCTDGDFNVGISDQSQLLALVQDKAKTGVSLSVLGFGFGNLQDSTLEKLADKGDGAYGYVDSLAEGRRMFVEQLTGTLATIARDVKLQVEFNPSKVVAYRLLGYENRLLAKEGFNDDLKGAAEIGAGHTVTALYEVVPSGQKAPAEGAVDELKYGSQAVGDIKLSPELLTVKVRYKQPDAAFSSKLEFPLTDDGATWQRSSRDFRWAAAVAGFGMLLRDSPHKGSLSWSVMEELVEGRSGRLSPEREEFLRLIETARGLGR